MAVVSLIQFFVLTGGRIEVALRVDTKQTFNPKSVHKISKDEISTVKVRAGLKNRRRSGYGRNGREED